MTLLEKLKEAVDAHSREETDKAGVGRIDILIARTREEGQAQRNQIDQTLAKALDGAIDLRQPGAWSAMRQFIEKLDVVSARLSDIVEAKLEANTAFASIDDRYDGLMTFVSLGGPLTPKMVTSERQLQQERPQLWFDLAMIAHRGDNMGLVSAVTTLLGGQHPLVHWTDIRKRLPKLRATLGHQEFNSSLVALASTIASSRDRSRLLASADELYGSKLAAPDGAHEPTDDHNQSRFGEQMHLVINYIIDRDVANEARRAA